jgi:hypothetical protein
MLLKLLGILEALCTSRVHLAVRFVAVGLFSGA